MQKSDCIISVEHVSKFFGDKAVLNDVNLFVRKGEFVTILGPSGCGKTTLFTSDSRISDRFGRGDLHCRKGDYANAATQKAGQYGVSEICIVPAPECFQ